MKGLPNFSKFINEHYSLNEAISKEKWLARDESKSNRKRVKYTRSSPSRKTILGWTQEDFKDSNGKPIQGKKALQDLVQAEFYKAFPSEIKLSTKAFSPSQLGGKSRDAKIDRNPPLKSPPNNPPAKSVTVDGVKLSRLSIPTDEDLTSALKKSHKGKTDKEIEEYKNRTITALERHNRLLDTYSGSNMKGLKFVEPVKGLKPDMTQKERGDHISKELPTALSDKMRKELTKGGRELDPKEEEIIKKWESLSDIKDPKEFEKASLDALTSMTADGKPPAPESMRSAAADMAESVVYMNLNKKGIRAELPDSANYPVADVISFGNTEKLSKLKPGSEEYLQELTMEGLPLVVSLEDGGGQSVKKDGGAASGATEKLKLSTFKNKDTRKELDGLIDNFSNFNGTSNEKSLDSAKENTEKTLKWAQDEGIVNEKWKPKIADEGLGSDINKWVSNEMKKLTKNAKGKENVDPNAERIFRTWFKDAALLADIHNKQIKSQDYGNVNVITGKDAGMKVTDGVNSLSMMKPSLSWTPKKLKSGKFIPKPAGIHQSQLKHKDR